MKQFMESCLGCLAAVKRNMVQPMIERPTPEGVLRKGSVDFKGPIGGKYCLHTIQDNVSR